MTANFDFGELNTLTADLGSLPTDAIRNVRKAVEVTARSIKDDWRDYAQKSNPRRARRYPSSISYDMKLNQDALIGAEIGPTLGGQGSLGGILEEGGLGNAPQRNAARAERDNLADFERGILRATEVNGL